MEHSCLFCLEAVRDKVPINPIGCACKVVAHEECFRTWFEQKQRMECPICHTISVPNRVMADTIHIVYINTEAVERDSETALRHDKCMGFCCLGLIGWTIGLTILELVFH